MAVEFIGDPFQIVVAHMAIVVAAVVVSELKFTVLAIQDITVVLDVVAATARKVPRRR